MVVDTAWLARAGGELGERLVGGQGRAAADGDDCGDGSGPSSARRRSIRYRYSGESIRRPVVGRVVAVGQRLVGDLVLQVQPLAQDLELRRWSSS